MSSSHRTSTSRLALLPAFAGFAASFAVACGGSASTASTSTSSSADPSSEGSSSESVGSAIETGDDAGAGDTTPTTSTTGSAGSSPSGIDPSLLVQTDKGTLRGTLDQGAYAFLGVPYAAPPVGALRWQPPAAVPAWTGQRDATAFGAQCVQLATDGTLAPGGSEDCLTINVWTPKTSGANRLPVMAFIHGGFFVKGGATTLWHGEEVYDGAELATRANVVVVTLQYRLGAFGFLAHPALSTPSAPHGNYALLDQIAALKWVQTNISNFGGDPSAVTAWGQSAGGTSVAALLATPQASGLFSRAIIESGGFTAYSVSTANADASAVATSLACAKSTDVAACLRAAPANAVATALPDSALGPLRWHFVEDGLMLSDDPVALFQSGAMNRVPVLLGTNRDELSAMIYDYLAAANLPRPTTQAIYESDITAMYGAKTGPLAIALYPWSAYEGQPAQGLAQLVADDQYICPTRAAARALATQTLPNGSPLPVWRYVFTHTLDPQDFKVATTNTGLGAYHFLEMPFVFHNLAPTDFTFDTAEEGLSQSMMSMWSSFATTGNPNLASGNGSGSAWPAYNGSVDSYFAIDTISSPETGVRTSQCDFWDQH